MADDSVKRERFGRYLILDHLVDGGMAKISRARFLGEQVDKVVAIKMVQPQYSKDEAFKTMFMDEIKVTFGLSHQNVIQTYDYGMHAGQLFVAMEYCDGRNLKEYIDKLKDRKFVFPVEISVYIISQACQGLYYAHTFRDKLTGVESSIIHRDISPHNIMMTFDGSVKIIDFGIAKSTKNSEQTQAGTIKGKLSYLAPEYLEGLDLDPRYDQFTLGITLWEMLCNRKLFKENNDLAVLKKIQECVIPVPSSINPNVPKELDAIVLKALSKDRNNRYDNLDQMNRALMKVLHAKFPEFNSTDLSFFAQELFREEIKKDREKLFEFGRINIIPYIEDLKRELAGGTDNVNNNSPSAPQARANADFDFSFTESEHLVIQAVKPSEKQKEIQKAKAVANVSDEDSEVPEKVKPKLGEKKAPTLTVGSRSAVSSKINHTSANSTSATNTIARKISKTSTEDSKSKLSSLGPVAAVIAIAIGAYAYTQGYFESKSLNKSASDQAISVNKNKKGPTPASVNVEEAPTHGTVFLTHFDKQKMQVFVNDKTENIDSLSSIKVPLNKEFILRVQIEGRKHFIKEVRVDNTSPLEIEIPEMPTNFYGYMNTSTACAEGEIEFEVFGEKRHSTIPMGNNYGIALPLTADDKSRGGPQTFSISFIRKGESKEKRFEITIKKEDQTIDLCEYL